MRENKLEIKIIVSAFTQPGYWKVGTKDLMVKISRKKNIDQVQASPILFKTE